MLVVEFVGTEIGNYKPSSFSLKTRGRKSAVGGAFDLFISNWAQFSGPVEGPLDRSFKPFKK